MFTVVNALRCSIHVQNKTGTARASLTEQLIHSALENGRSSMLGGCGAETVERAINSGHLEGDGLLDYAPHAYSRNHRTVV